MRWIWLMLSFSSVAWAADSEQGWLVGTEKSKRFLDEATVGPEFAAGTRVVVLAHEGELVRVSVGDRFGWVPASAITNKAPATGAITPPPGIPGLPDVKVIPTTPKP